MDWAMMGACGAARGGSIVTEGAVVDEPMGVDGVEALAGVSHVEAGLDFGPAQIASWAPDRWGAAIALEAAKAGEAKEGGPGRGLDPVQVEKALSLMLEAMPMPFGPGEAFNLGMLWVRGGIALAARAAGMPEDAAQREFGQALHCLGGSSHGQRSMGMQALFQRPDPGQMGSQEAASILAAMREGIDLDGCVRAPGRSKASRSI